VLSDWLEEHDDARADAVRRVLRWRALVSAAGAEELPAEQADEHLGEAWALLENTAEALGALPAGVHGRARPASCLSGSQRGRRLSGCRVVPGRGLLVRRLVQARLGEAFSPWSPRPRCGRGAGR
jgi:hypothetical protein